MTNDEKLLAKLKKILALCDSPNENEATAAAGHLARLLGDHNLAMSDVESLGDDAVTVDEFIGIQRSGNRWRALLALALAKDYFVTVLTLSSGTALCWIGRPVNVAAMKIAFAFLVENIVTNATYSRPSYTSALTWQNGFGHGAVSRIRYRLQDQRDDKAGAMGALVVTRKSENDEHIEDKWGDIKPKRRSAASRVNSDALDAGRRYGSGCSLASNPAALRS